MLLPISVPDPWVGRPGGCASCGTTRGLLLRAGGAAEGGQLGVLGVDGSFHDDGRFNPLPASVLPTRVARDRDR